MANRDFTEREKEMSGRSYDGNELRYLTEVLNSGQLSSLAGGTFVPRFEQEFARIIGTPHAIAMNSCMSALHAAVLASGAGPGSEVICDSEFIFSTMAVLYCNAIPVFVDIDPVTHNMNPDCIEQAITDRTKAIIVTHAWGLPAKIDQIVEIGHKHGLMVIEDCAESILATYKGRCTGSWGDAGCFSFQASKQMSLGDGGMATANDERIAKALHNHAGAPTWLSVAYNLDYNYRMNEPTAAIGLAQLEILPNTIEQLRTNAVYYDQAIEGCNWLRLQRGPDAAHHSFYHWVATFTGDESGLNLEEFKRIMSESGPASVSIGYTQIPSYKHPVIKDRLAYAFHCTENRVGADRYYDGLCPVAEKVIPRIVLGYVLGSEETAKTEAEKLHKVIGILGG